MEGVEQCAYQFFDPKLPNNTGCFCPVTFLRVRFNTAIKRCRPDGGIYAKLRSRQGNRIFRDSGFPQFALTVTTS